MNISNETMTEILNRMLRTCYDSQHGYKAASEHVSSSIISKLLSDYSEQRGRYANELIDEIIKYCGAPVAADGIVQNVKRGWQNLTDVLSKKDANAIIQECRQGDEAAMDQYEHALAENLPPMTKAMLMKHYEAMRQSVSRLKVLQKTVD